MPVSLLEFRQHFDRGPVARTIEEDDLDFGSFVILAASSRDQAWATLKPTQEKAAPAHNIQRSFS